MAACHRFRFQPRTSFRLRSLPGRMERHFPDVGAWNEFNSTALRNWLRSHSSDKFLIVCPAPSGGVRAFPPSTGMVTALLRRADHQYLCPGHNRGIPSVPGSFSDPRPAGPLMVMVITGSNCEQWNYEISKFAATVLASTHASSFCDDSLFQHCLQSPRRKIKF